MTEQDSTAPGRPKVFGIGLQRTGTTTLTSALRLLGYRSFHFPAHLWDDPEHPLLDEYDAFFDNPIPLIYKDLDARFPGSKFILTTRDEEGWLKSCEWLFTEMREEWGFDTSARLKAMHTHAYGTNHFDEEAFRRAFRSHRDDVRAYFADRPGDLLVLDIAEEDKWTPLCDFLGVDRPTVPFPHQNPSGRLARWVRAGKKALGRVYRALASRMP